MAQSTEAYKNVANPNDFLTSFKCFEVMNCNDDTFGTNAKGYVVGAQLLWNVFDGINPLEKRRLISKKRRLKFNNTKLKPTRIKQSESPAS
jgi:hypothetical protein